MKKGFIMAIDGPVAAGKGTIAKKLSRDLQAFYLYTGAMYRIVALACIEKGIDLHNEGQVVAELPSIAIRFDGEQVFFNDKEVTERIKEADAANGSSVVAAFPKVREHMVALQQQIAHDAIAAGKIVVSEGRDTGTKVFPNADIKIYLTANDEVRAKRRVAQFKDQGKDVPFEQVLQDIKERDQRDKGRITDPLPSNPEELDYFIVDNSDENEEQAILAELKRRGLI